MINKKVFFDYEVLDKFTCGVVLLGTETKSIRNGLVNFTDSYCVINNNEVLLRNFYIDNQKTFVIKHELKRDIKLLLHKSEINKLKVYLQTKGITLIPIEITTINNKYKIVIGVCRGKKKFEKRESIKLKDLKKFNNVNIK